MSKSVIALAALAALASSAAVAENIKQEKQIGPVQMSDSEMDRVTAGDAVTPTPADGTGTALSTGVASPNAGSGLPGILANGVNPGFGQVGTVPTTPGHL